jgi:hypothetical protein
MPQVINTVTKAAPTDNYPVVNDTDLSGSYRIVADITARDGIVSSQRKQSMLVFVISTLNFYQLQSDLLTWTNLGTSLGGGSSLPIVRYVYLVQDASDATRMGGAASNVYTTFQAAYTAANTLQVTLGGTNVVVIKIGNTTAATVGDVTLTANWNRFVFIVGDGIADSVVGSIVGNNAAGNGFSVGTLAQPVNFSNVFLNNITTNATGATGNSGTINVQCYNFRVNTLSTAITNVANTAGNGGRVDLASLFNSNCVVGTLTTSSQSTTSNAGLVNISGSNTNIITATTANNNSGGNFNMQPTFGRSIVQNLTVLASNTSTNTGCSVANTAMGAVNLRLSGGATGITFDNIYCNGNVTILNNGIGVSNVRMRGFIFSNQNPNSLTLNSNSKLTAVNCDFYNIISLGDNSTLTKCTLGQQGATTIPTINGIGTGCKLINTSIDDGSFGISNTIAVSISVFGTLSYIQNGVDSNVTLNYNYGVQPLANGGGGNYAWDCSRFNQTIMSTIDGAPFNIVMSNIAIGETYIMHIHNENPAGVLQFSGGYTFAVAQVGSTGGTYLPTNIINAYDRLMITYDGSTVFIAPTGQDFQF